ncbi:peptide/nickel transport system permease protein [Tindallia magadiensis]|uniref:Peptide/nickel transport system permease protein n=1 Tax=Tindallia magadiensis TaxID=69895 RepID=A0A1I3GU36_9FIRM|nr:ABC transporter permease [Tindallia magadiensis]SFI26917.1 peptide/nickel transport system permease protein [Tindallia magadiensis]
MTYALPYALKKIILALPVLIGVSVIAFLLGVVALGDPAREALSADGVSTPTQEEIDVKRRELGLDQSLGKQYQQWIGGILQGDLGTSFMTNIPIAEEFRDRLPKTVALSISALLLVIFLSIPLAVLMAVYQHSWFDHIGRLFSLLLISTPGFLAAILLMMFFSVHLRWLPTSGYGTFSHLIIPSLVLAFGTSGVIMRVNRATLLEVLNKNYILNAHAKGLTNPFVLYRHALRNSLLPVITLIGNYFGGILGGSAIVETIFAIPGVGRYAVEGIMSMDYPVIQAYVLFTGVVYVLFNLLIDLSYIIIDPRIRLGGDQG